MSAARSETGMNTAEYAAGTAAAAGFAAVLVLLDPWFGHLLQVVLGYCLTELRWEFPPVWAPW